MQVKVLTIMWRLAPKELNSGIKMIEIAIFIIAGIFYEDYYIILKIMETLNITPLWTPMFFTNTTRSH